MEWIGVDKTQNRTQFDGEVILGYENHGKDTRVQFKFRKNSSFKITTSEHIYIARDTNKIYFKEGDEKGFKLGNYGQNTKIIKVRLDKFFIPKEELGEYDLEFDTKLGLHYICLVRKKEAPSLNWEGRK